MNRRLGSRLERLEKTVAVRKETVAPYADCWLKWLDDWPTFLIADDALPAERLAKVKAACQAIARRMRARELTDLNAALDQLPDEALQGIIALCRRSHETCRAVGG